MKKLLVVVLGMLFVFGFTASAFAIHADIPSETQAVVAKGATQITVSGEIRVRGDYQKATFNKDLPAKALYDERVRLGLEAKVTPNTMGFIQLESTNDDPTNASQDWNAWGTGNAATATTVPGAAAYDRSYATGGYTQGNSKKGSLRILQSWIQHQGSGLLGMPAGVKIGHMPLALGNGLFFDHTKFGDDAIVLFANPMKELELNVITIKFREGVSTLNDDANAQVFVATYKPNKDTSVSFDVTYVDDQNAGHTTTTQAVPTVTQTTNTDNTSSQTDTHLWNFGLRGNTTMYGVSAMADVEMQTGKTRDASPEKKFRGYAVKAGLGYTLAPVKLSLDYAYGSGEGTDTSKNKAFVTSLGADQHFTYVYEYRTINAAGTQYGGLTNTQYVKLGANSDVAKDLNVDAGLYYLTAAKKNTTTTLNGSTLKGDSKYIGTELDAKVTYNIDRNLKYWVEGGYLWAGKFWNTTARDADDAYSVRHGIQLSF